MAGIAAVSVGQGVDKLLLQTSVVPQFLLTHFIRKQVKPPSQQQRKQQKKTQPPLPPPPPPPPSHDLVHFTNASWTNVSLGFWWTSSHEKYILLLVFMLRSCPSVHMFYWPGLYAVYCVAFLFVFVFFFLCVCDCFGDGGFCFRKEVLLFSPY